MVALYLCNRLRHVHFDVKSEIRISKPKMTMTKTHGEVGVGPQEPFELTTESLKNSLILGLKNRFLTPQKGLLRKRIDYPQAVNPLKVH
jgi:hypothetical protein